MKKNIVITSHKFLTQPDDDLVIFLRDKKCENILHIRHSFSDAVDRKSFYTWYKKGKIYREEETKDYKGIPEPLLYVKEWWFTTKWIIRSETLWDTYIGMDGLCVLFGNTLKSMRRVKQTIFWAIDFVPDKRFSSGIKNKIYHMINIHGYRNSDEMWDLSPRMAEAREKFLGIKKTEYRVQKVVPYGVWEDRIRKYSYKECEKNTIVFMGHLLEKQGVQLIIKALPELLKTDPTIKFKVIGAGQYKNELVSLAKKLKVMNHCEFKGKIEDHRELENEIAKSCVAVAPYIKALDTWTYYADPGKVKTYLACGVPVLLTDIPWNTQEIIKSKCGMILEDNGENVVSSISSLLDGKTNQRFRENAIGYSKKFSYNTIFANLEL